MLPLDHNAFIIYNKAYENIIYKLYYNSCEKYDSYWAIRSSVKKIMKRGRLSSKTKFMDNKIIEYLLLMVLLYLLILCSYVARLDLYRCIYLMLLVLLIFLVLRSS